MDTSDSSMETSNGTGNTTGVAVPGTVPGVSTIASVVASAASLALVKAEAPEHLAGTSATVSAVTGPVGTGSGLFAGIASSNKTSRPDDWLATGSPGSPPVALQSQHVVYTTPQQQLSDPQPPLAHSSPLAHQQQQPAASNNGYASPMSTSSYDPYSPNSKIAGPPHRKIVRPELRKWS
ncbi:ecdysone receptor-like isoform X1 [Polistes fuscatus]|uniref:ecdysone receptor-like isoform X1 n=1 Tax=Polistes fuscatus TaxID=30207 RepID=UPI001CA82C85|nr:ecdysone receptor-like isoform X1 [Polistes fuscatus]XP_043495682.1 ecdysone receptor-like isoform X1 [Polistes fuscatus]XP_043495683.1 ecdysone receptor-like isoform X1 [Polistes fuscatus]XP_043495684.1 ecdysone receptor-like isoform X1 [Polistes fuscatus]XP_043495685.1 ecdysone receptor-like isoform X1 [Polistes fuscatus]XP_043495686.1 ecdysone receptor-like isoform X1 [Polistes fuscatus]XP_043495687.1 ecdysone receptor-like isoform X1 [Polistes fuscatus]